jgi:hypothetical protein
MQDSIIITKEYLLLLNDSIQGYYKNANDTMFNILGIYGVIITIIIPIIYYFMQRGYVRKEISTSKIDIETNIKKEIEDKYKTKLENLENEFKNKIDKYTTDSNKQINGYYDALTDMLNKAINKVKSSNNAELKLLAGNHFTSVHNDNSALKNFCISIYLYCYLEDIHNAELVYDALKDSNLAVNQSAFQSAFKYEDEFYNYDQYKTKIHAYLKDDRYKTDFYNKICNELERIYETNGEKDELEVPL